TPDSTPALQHRAPPRRNRLRHPRRRTHRTRRRDPRPPPARASPRTRKPNTISSQQHEKEKMSTPLNWLGKQIPKCHIYSDTPQFNPEVQATALARQTAGGNGTDQTGNVAGLNNDALVLPVGLEPTLYRF